MDLVEPEPVAHRPELLDVGLDRPERGIVRAVGIPAPELVVVDDAPSLLRELPEPFERQMRPARPAVQTEQRQPARHFAVAEDDAVRLPVPETKPAGLRHRPGRLTQSIVQVSPACSRPARSPSP